jgi:hypothetical protein
MCIFYIFLILGLTYVGLKTLYIPNATFGANGVMDYFPLLFYGVGQDIVGASVMNLDTIFERFKHT